MFFSRIKKRPNHYDAIIVDELACKNGLAGV